MAENLGRPSYFHEIRSKMAENLGNVVIFTYLGQIF